MQNTLRIVLILFLFSLIILNFNSIRSLNIAIRYLSEDLRQRSSLVSKEIRDQLTAQYQGVETTQEELQKFLRAQMKSYSIDGLYLLRRKSFELKMLTMPDRDIDPLLGQKGLKQSEGTFQTDQYFVISRKVDPENILILIFDARKIYNIQNSTKIISYLNFLLVAIAGIVAFYFIEATTRPYRMLLQTARSAPAGDLPAENRNEADFLISTFKGVIARLKDKEQELEKMHQAEKTRADDVQHLNQDLIRSISSGLILIDRSGKVRIFNHAAEKILNVSRLMVLNHHYSDKMVVLSPTFKDDIDRCFAEQIPVQRAEVEISKPGEEQRFIGANIMPLYDRQGIFAGVFCLFTDITEFKHLQNTMILKEKYASLGEMAAGVAHEFRNSLATITGYMQMLENKIDQTQKNYAISIHQELQLLQRVVNEFLSFARPVEPDMEDLNLQELLEDCLKEVRVSPFETPVQFELGGDFPAIRGDEAMLRQVFTNLIRNAAEATQNTERNGVVVIRGKSGADQRSVMIEVEDNGNGIPPENLGKVFNPFFSTKQNGVGLGLAIVQKLVLQHNGKVSVESSPSGSTFKVQLPV